MGVAYYISLDVEGTDFDTTVDGKTIANADEMLNEIASENDMPELMSFFGMGGEELGDILGEEDMLDAGEWHDSGEGAVYFRRLAQLVGRRSDSGSLVSLIEELNEFASILEKAHSIGAKWQMGMDI